MARNSGRSSSRPVASRAPIRTAPQKREASTMSAVAPTGQAPVHVPQQQGILGQIATTAAGVAAGHVAGRMITGLFTGSPAMHESQSANYAQEPVGMEGNGMAQTNTRSVAPQCQEYSRLFLQCMESNDNQFSTCQDYMDMMKACQQQYA